MLAQHMHAQLPCRPGDFSLLLAVAKSVVGVGGVDGPALLGSLLQSYIDGSSSNRRFGPYDRVVLDAVLGGSEPLQVRAGEWGRGSLRRMAYKLIPHAATSDHLSSKRASVYAVFRALTSSVHRAVRAVSD